jgi:hypothetical protein
MLSISWAFLPLGKAKRHGRKTVGTGDTRERATLECARMRCRDLVGDIAGA